MSTRDCSEIESILLNITKHHKTNKIETRGPSSDIFRQFKVADIFENVELYLRTEKILEERVRHTLLHWENCRGRPREVFAPKLVTHVVNGNRRHLVQVSKWTIPDSEAEQAAWVKMTTTMDTENQLSEREKRTQWCTFW